LQYDDQRQHDHVETKPTKPPRHFTSSSSSSSSLSLSSPATAAATTRPADTRTTAELSKSLSNEDQAVRFSEIEDVQNVGDNDYYDDDTKATINEHPCNSSDENGTYCDAHVEYGSAGHSRWPELNVKDDTGLREGNTSEEIIRSGFTSLQSFVFNRPISSTGRNGEDNDLDRSTDNFLQEGGLFNGRKNFSSLTSDCRQEAKKISERLDIVVTDPDEVGTESVDNYVEKLDNETEVSSTEVHETSSEESLAKMRLENQLLQVRVDELMLKNRNLKVDVDSVKQLVAASHELKRENEALLDEYRDFKQHVLNTKCPDCLQLIYQNKMLMSLAFGVGGTQFQEIAHATGTSKVYLACKQIKPPCSLATYHDKLLSVPALEEMLESRLQADENEYTDGGKSEGTTAKYETEIETEHKSTHSASEDLEYNGTSCQLYEEITASVTFEPSDSSDDSAAYASKFMDNDDGHDCPDVASCEKIIDTDDTDTLDGNRLQHKDYVLLSKRRVEDLLAEIAALKRTVLEQSCYLETAHNRFSSQEDVIQQSDACLQTDETNLRRTPTSEAETLKKYNTLLTNLRKTCDLANAIQTGDGSCEHLRETSDEDYLSVDELLLLINGYEQLHNEKKVVEEENRILGMEIDELASRLTKAEGKEDDGSLSSIYEEKFEERLAEMEDRLDSKEEELSKLRKALAEKNENEKMMREKFMALQESKTVAEKVVDLKTNGVEDLERGESAKMGENYAVFRQINSITRAISNNFRSEMHVTLNEREDSGCAENQTELKPKVLENGGSSLLDSERTVMDSEDDDQQCAVRLKEKKLFEIELRKVEQDLFKLEASLQPEISRLEAENGRLREELEQWKRLKFQADNGEDKGSVQERAAEVEQLSQKLESTRSELAARNEAYRQLEEACRHLEQAGEQPFGHSDERIPENNGVDRSASEKLVEKVRLLQLANSNLVDENIGLTVQLETEDRKIGISYEAHNGMLADEETSDFKLCNGAVSEDGLPDSRDVTSTCRKEMENDANTNSSEVSRDQEVGLMTQQLPPEVVPQDFEVGDSDIEQLQSLSAVVTQPAVNAEHQENPLESSPEPEDRESIAFTQTGGSADRLGAHDLVCRSLLYEFLLSNLTVIRRPNVEMSTGGVEAKIIFRNLFLTAK